MSSGQGLREVYFEFVAIGRQVKCTAICSQTGVEVSVFGPVTAAKRDLETIALRKLEARLAADKPLSHPPVPGGGSRLL